MTKAPEIATPLRRSTPRSARRGAARAGSRQTVRGATRAGFTLIELMAVVAIMMLIFGLGLPRLAASPWAALDAEAERLAQTLRFARQRAIMTGTPHRLLIDLEEGGYLVEWLMSEEAEEGGGLADLATLLAEGPGADEGGSELLAFTPPRRGERDYYPIPSRRMGTFQWLDEAHYFIGIDGPGGWVEGGDYEIVFGADGLTDAAMLQLADAEDHQITLELEPLLQHVRVFRGGAGS